MTYSEKAHDAAIQAGKKLKSTEIALRKMAAKLRDIKRTATSMIKRRCKPQRIAWRACAPILLAHMFGKGKANDVYLEQTRSLRAGAVAALRR